MSQTINEVAEDLHKALVQYIEATYHIGDPGLIKQRNHILLEEGVIHQKPYIESTPKYSSGTTFGDIPGLHPSALKLFEDLSIEVNHKTLIYNPPYLHQAEAVEKTLCGGDTQNIIIMTGTGSGKTESFLLPILGKLAIEAAENAAYKSQFGMRALILYPMNALVNDQLGRLRAFFGDSRLQKHFIDKSGRIPTFARYTSRTPYAGARTVDKDKLRLAQFRSFYVQQLQAAKDPDPKISLPATMLIQQLKDKGKWPAKPDIEKWFGDGKHWQEKNSDKFLRAITLPGDAELLTRHEVQTQVPDLMVTNYSMLEYMMMRPIEQPIFDTTKEWLSKNKNEKFLVVLDEAHLYRGAAGAEVGHLLRRLRSRLDIPEDRFQVICSTASFSDMGDPKGFASQLTGVPVTSFSSIKGSFAYKSNFQAGTASDGEMLASLDLDKFYDSQLSVRKAAIAPLLTYLKGLPSDDIDLDLHSVLKDFAPLSLLINSTMGKALPISDIGKALFPDNPVGISNKAASNLASLASTARVKLTDPSLLPCRVHSFHRGLKGLWICMDKDCTEKTVESVAGKMYSQPRDTCGCKAKVLPLFTCRYCGTAFARGYTENITDPKIIWPEPGTPIFTNLSSEAPLKAIDLLLEDLDIDEKDPQNVEICSFDLETGEINSNGSRVRTVYFPSSGKAPMPKVKDEDNIDEEVIDLGDGIGIFQPCPVCRSNGFMGLPPVQDHETKGDQPFQVLVTQQLATQPPGPKAATTFAPLRGKKVLVFSDSRQVAARLAPNLQMFASRDSLRALIVRGFDTLNQIPNYSTRLTDLYAAVLLSAAELDVRIRPELTNTETFELEKVRKAVKKDILKDKQKLADLCIDLRAEKPPESLFGDIYESLRDKTRGLEALGIASIVERAEHRDTIYELPMLNNVAQSNDEKLAVVRAWIRCWNTSGVFISNSTPESWQDSPNSKRRIRSHKSGAFERNMKKLFEGDPKAWTTFKFQWLQVLLDTFTVTGASQSYRLSGKELTLRFNGEWVRCKKCRSVHRPMNQSKICQECWKTGLEPLDPEKDEVFLARKSFYRNAVLKVLGSQPEAPISLIAGEHTAQLNSQQDAEVFSKAEQNELLFQDVELPPESNSMPFSAIDVLSSTTTMEVGIDIGQLSGVALRNMPPARSNYQQRAGRAGRRGNAIATVIAFGGSNTHDEHYFSHPQEMISGDVIDPKLSLDKVGIANRHICAFLLQNYHRSKLAQLTAPSNGDLFSVLGSVTDFQTNGILNIYSFEEYLKDNEVALRQSLDDWLPQQLNLSDRNQLLDGFIDRTVTDIRVAISDYKYISKPKTSKLSPIVDEDDGKKELAPETGENDPTTQPDPSKLLDWLLYKAVLPRYAFPTDVATFHVFDKDLSSDWASVDRYSPSQNLAVALSQYAPGQQVWVAGKCYTSGAIYSPDRTDLSKTWNKKKHFLECTRCGYSAVQPVGEDVELTASQPCPACGTKDGIENTRVWIRPIGFAHPINDKELTSPDEIPDKSYATRAQLTMKSPSDNEWKPILENIRFIASQDRLLVSNSGPDKLGYIFCSSCGRIEAETQRGKKLLKVHDKPYRAKDPKCTTSASRHIVLGTDFVTDVALFSLRLQAPLRLRPNSSITKVALRTVSEALAAAATDLLQIEPTEIMAEFRPALSSDGIAGLEAEIFLYDTLPGGAGFSKNAAEQGDKLFTKALEILEGCPGKSECDTSCYRCIRTFRNRPEHSLLDRHIGASLLRYLISGNIDSFSDVHFKNSEQKLFNAVSKLISADTKINQKVEVKSLGGEKVTLPILLSSETKGNLIIALTNPLTEELPSSKELLNLDPALGNLKLINEFIVRKNLPAAVKQILQF